MVFVVSQVIGVALAFYSMETEVGVGGVREFLSIPPLILLFPGWLLGYAALALDLNQLDRWYGAPFFASVVVVNAVCWNLVAALIQRGLRRRRAPARH
jgi:hypothetical protein